MLDRRIKIRHLEGFSAIARFGSLKAACAVLNLSPPALSKTLKDLEDILGTQLMTRDRGGTRMTPEGALFLDFTNQSLAALRRGVDSIATPQAQGAEPLRVGALPSVAARLMPEAVVRFRGAAPNTRLTLLDGARGALTEALRAGALDLVVGRLGAAETMTGLSFTQLYIEPVVCVARADHPLHAIPPRGDVRAAHLPDWPVLYPPEDAAIRPLVDRWCLAMGVPPLPDRIDCVSSAFGRSYLRLSDALWFISEGVVAQDLLEGRFKQLDLDLALAAGPVGLMRPAQTPPSRSAALFEHALRLSLPDDPQPHNANRWVSTT